MTAWTPEEVELLEDLISTCTVSRVAEKLGRTRASVASKMQRMGIGGFEKKYRSVECISGVPDVFGTAPNNPQCMEKKGSANAAQRKIPNNQAGQTYPIPEI